MLYRDRALAPEVNDKFFADCETRLGLSRRYNGRVPQDLNVGPIEAKRNEEVFAQPLERNFSLRQRLAIWLISTAVTLAIRIIGPTLRYTVEVEEGSAPGGHIFPGIYCFWHECIFSAAYIHRNNAVSVMTSRSFDGEYIARIIENLGFGAVRGSSSRGGVRALLEMHKVMEGG